MVMKFRFSPKLVVDSEKEPFKSEGIRIGFYSAPGTRKSYTVAACIVEPFLEEGGVVVIFQPRSEWHTLKEKWGSIVVAGGPFQDIPIATQMARVYAEAIVNDGVSMVFDFSETEEQDLVRFAAELLARIFTLQNVVRRPLLLLVEEAADYTPFSTKGKLVEPWIYDRMKGRIVKIATQGRPLGFMMVLVSQRPAQLDFTVRMMCNLSFYGKFHPKDLNDIKTMLSAYEVEAKETAEKCVNMPHGSWIAITSEGVTELSITAKRITSHGADTPRLEYTAPRTEETKKTVSELVEAIQKALEQERLEESELAKVKRKIADLERDVKDRDEKISTLESALEVASRLEIKAPESKVDQQEVLRLREELEAEKSSKSIIVNDIQKFLQSLKIELDETFEKETEHFLGVKEEAAKPPQGMSEDIAKMWLEKLPNPCSRNVFSFLLKHKGMKFTKSQIALQCGYSSNSGSFGSALSLLRKNNLVKTNRELWWVEGL